MSIKVLKIIIPIILVGLIAWNLYPENTELETKRQLDEIKKQAELAADKSNEDLDGDGLLNWEEELYKTDPENKDTDNDGVNDKEEIEQNRSPIVFGVGLTADLQDLVALKSLAEVSANVPENLENVQVVGRINSLADYLKEAGYTSVEDASRNQTEKQNKIREYFNAVADRVLLAAEDSGTLNESLFALYEGQASNADKQALRSLASRYKNIGESLSEVQNPEFITDGNSGVLSKIYEELSESFMTLINAQGSYGNNDFKIKADAYTKIITERNTEFVQIHNYVKKENVYFSDSDSGKFFLFEVSGGL